MNRGATFNLGRFDDIADDILLKTYAKNPYDNTPRSDEGGYNLSNRSPAPIFDFNIADKSREDLEDMARRNRYVGRSAVESYPQSRIKWDENTSGGSASNRRMKSSDPRPFRMLDSSQILAAESRREADRRERRVSLWETKYDKKHDKLSDLSVIDNPSSRRSSQGEGVPIGIFCDILNIPELGKVPKTILTTKCNLGNFSLFFIFLFHYIKKNQ